MNFTISLDELKGRMRMLRKSVTSAGERQDGMDCKFTAAKGDEDKSDYLQVEVVGAQGYGITRLAAERIDEFGSAVVNANHIFGLPDNMGGSLSFVLQKNKKLKVYNEKMEHQFETGSDEDWNRLQILKATFELSGDLLAELNQAIPHVCAFAKSTKEWDVHSAVRMRWQDSRIILQATDISNAIQKVIEIPEGVTLPDLDLYIPAAWLATWPSLAGNEGIKIGYQEGSSFLTIHSNPVKLKVTHNTLDGSKFRDVGELITRIESKIEFTSNFVANAVRMLPALDTVTCFQKGDPDIVIDKSEEAITLASSGGEAESKVNLNDGNEVEQVEVLSSLRTNERSFKMLLTAARDLAPNKLIHLRANEKVVYGVAERGLSVMTTQTK